MNLLSNGKISKVLGDRLHSLYIVVTLSLTRSRILSLGRKVIVDSCREISMILTKVEKFGFIVNG